MIRVTMMLADAAQSVGGKLYILGGGWNITGPQPVPSAIALLIEVPWDQANRRHAWKIALFDEDGQPVLMPTAGGEQAVQVTADFEVGRPPGLKPGTPLIVPLAINMGPLPLLPDRCYVWRCSINDQTREDWRATFVTRPGDQPKDA